MSASVPPEMSRPRESPAGGADLRTGATPARVAEFDALVRFLMAHAHPLDGLAHEVAERIAAGCLGEKHLWRDMELPSRAHLSALFERHFPDLKRENDKNMRWKKFLYKRLCGWRGFSH